MSFTQRFDQGTPISSKSETLSVGNTQETLEVPGGANMAIIQIIDAASHTDKTKALRYTLDGTTPANSYASGAGFQLGEKDFVILQSRDQLTGFKCKTSEDNLTVVVYVEYYKGNY